MIQALDTIGTQDIVKPARRFCRQYTEVPKPVKITQLWESQDKSDWDYAVDKPYSSLRFSTL